MDCTNAALIYFALVRNEARPNGNDAGGVQANDNNGVAPNADAATSTEDNGAAQAAENNVAAAAGVGQHRLAYYRDVTWTFLTTFFTSLIPEMPQHN